MTNNHISFENDYDRGRYAREISNLFEQNNIRWGVYPSVTKSEIFIRPRDPPEENLRAVSRISLQVKDNAISFGVSGYYSNHIREIRRALESKGYNYHDKGYNSEGKSKGRWWLTKPVYNLWSIPGELKDIEQIIFRKVYD